MKSRLRVTINLRSTLFVTMERCGVKKGRERENALQKTIAKRRSCYYCPSKKKKKNAKAQQYAGNATKMCVKSTVMLFM